MKALIKLIAVASFAGAAFAQQPIVTPGKADDFPQSCESFLHRPAGHAEPMIGAPHGKNRQTISSVRKEALMSEANKALVRRVIEELFTMHNVALIDELFSDCVYRSPAVGELRGEAYKQFLATVLAAFPDGRWTVEDQVAEGDKVVTRWGFTGIHRGSLMGIAPTGKQVTTSGVMIDRIVGGKIAEEWEEYDSLGMMQQLGAVPATAKDKAAA